MKKLSASSQKQIVIDGIKATKLSGWIYGRDGGNFPKSSPPLPKSERVIAIEFIESKETDTEGAAIITADKIYFVFRGSESPLSGGILDWVTNFKTMNRTEWFGLKCHRGFKKAAQSVLYQVLDILQKYKEQNLIEFHGHSLGGAVTVLTAVGIAHKLRRLGQVDREIRIITIGQPRVSSTRTLNLALRYIPYIRIQNGADVVPRIPKLGYSHGGDLVYITGDGDILFAPSHWARIRDRFGAGLSRLKDHSTIEYLLGLSNYKGFKNV